MYIRYIHIYKVDTFYQTKFKNKHFHTVRRTVTCTHARPSRIQVADLAIRGNGRGGSADIRPDLSM